jgi:tetratricopeptide (TPR) repeat protein
MRLGDIYLQFHSLPEARKQFEFAVPRFRDIQDSGFSSLAYCTHQLAEIDLREGKWKNAEERFNKAIHMYEQLGDRETQGLIASMFGLTRLYRTLQDVAKADAVMAETMRRTRTLPERPLTFGLMIAELAELAILHGNLPKADQHYKLALQESITRRGPIHREVAYILDRHADLLDRMKQRSNAAELRRKARSIRNQTL